MAPLHLQRARLLAVIVLALAVAMIVYGGS
jgi:hypothetical protein